MAIHRRFSFLLFPTLSNRPRSAENLFARQSRKRPSESTVAAVGRVTPSEHPLPNPQQSASKKISAGNRINNSFQIATARTGVEVDFNISQISAISTETCGSQRVNCTCRKSAVCTNRGDLHQFQCPNLSEKQFAAFVPLVLVSHSHAPEAARIV